MTIKVFTIEPSAWIANDIDHALLLGEFADESDALTGIWQDLVQNRHYRAYLLFDRHPWVKFWRKPVAIVWAGLYKDMPRMYQEPLGQTEEKRAAKLYGLKMFKA